MEKQRQERLLGALYFTLFVFLILSGIIMKRVFGHPEYMMLFHLPAAVFLVLGGHKLMAKHKRAYLADLQAKSRAKASFLK